MKVYVHYEEEEEFTFIVNIENNNQTTLMNAIGYHLSKRGRTIKPDQIKLYTDKGKPLQKIEEGMDILIKMNVEGAIMKIYQEAQDNFNKKFYKKSLELFQQLLKLKVDPLGCLTNMGVIYSLTEQYEQAKICFEQIIKIKPDEYKEHQRLGEAHFGLKQYKEAIKCLEKSISISKDVNENDYSKVWIGRCYLELKQKDNALKYFSEVLERNPDHHFALLYSSSLLPDPFDVYLKLILQNQQSKEVKKLIAYYIHEKGVQFVLDYFKVEKRAQLLSFIANIVKEYSFIDEAIKLFEESVKEEPNNISYILSTIHAMEISLLYKESFEKIKRFLETNPNLSIQNFKCSHFLSLLNGENIDIKVENNSKKYDNNELNLLALYYTCVKVLYILGDLETITRLIPYIDHLKSNRDLHLTIIRNENAYYSEISSLVPMKSVTNHKPLYICGDSHCLSPAWNVIDYKGEKRTLIPKLATGVKCYHLRKESTFYPKKNFENVIDTIPKGSDVILLFGEIDCREGLLLAVEKFKYQSIEQGMEFVIDVYMDKIKEIIKNYGFNIFVHPVLPTLDVTRSLVFKFNDILQAKCGTNNLKFLDFAEDLITKDLKLKKELELDGTHIHPSYLKYLENELKNFK